MDKLQKIVALSKRRGLVFLSSEIYGGLSAVWDYGPIGMLIKRRLSDLWLNEMLSLPNVVSLDSAIFMAPQVWQASGHEDNFVDDLVDCRACRHRFRSESEIDEKCPQCHSDDLTPKRHFNLMLRSSLGALEGQANYAYLRPETAQGIFVNFRNVLNSCRLKIPFGIAQVGKAFRNEITPKNFLFRNYEFEQMEMEFFIPPSEEEYFLQFWKERRWQFYMKILKFRSESLYWHQQEKTELAHYSRSAYDLLYQFPMGFQEVEGLHARGDYDLRQHYQHAPKGSDLMYRDVEKKEEYLPFIIESSCGLSRLFFAVLCEAYEEEILEKETRIVLKLAPELSAYYCVILPLMRKEPLLSLAKKLYTQLQEELSHLIFYDENGHIGKRYRRYDEIGVPYSITIDYQSLEDKTITVRFRDSMHQERCALSQLTSFLKEKTKQYVRGQ